jgi:cell division protease FtsH
MSFKIKVRKILLRHETTLKDRIWLLNQKKLRSMNQNQIKSKHQVLENARQVLKSQFFGIDKVIDQIIDSISSWYHFPELQTRPLVVNLWGMTGVGKSDLIKTLVKLIDFNKSFFHFDMGEQWTRETSKVKDVLSYLSIYDEPHPSVIVLDEFQTLRSLSEERREMNNGFSRVVWKLIDEGWLDISPGHNYHQTKVQELIGEIRYWITQGLKVDMGIVSPSCKDYLNEKHDESLRESSLESDQYFARVSNRFVFTTEDIRELYCIHELGFRTKRQVKQRIRSLDEAGLVLFLEECWEKLTRPKSIDLTRSLVFVVGNLDEVYHFHNDQSSDISPNDFYLRSLEIKLPDIKKALQNRFRNEQIARLGNNHIIYPGLSEKAFYQIIDHELMRVSQNIFDKSGIEMKFSTRLKSWLFSEGVVATQGVRPLKSTIKYAIEDLVPNILMKALTGPDQPSIIEIDCNESILVTYSDNDTILSIMELPLNSKVDCLKKNRSDDMQALVAVHESGHAVLEMALFGKVPSKILSVASDSGVGGMVQNEWYPKLRTKGQLANEVSVLLGGYEAESLIFGEGNISKGSGSDIEAATELTVNCIKNFGFGKNLIRSSINSDDYVNIYHNVSEAESEAKEIIEAARDQAQQVLYRESVLLVQLGKVLAEQPSLNSNEIKQLAEEYGTEELLESLNEKRIGYREMLFSGPLKIKELEEKLN